MGLTGCMCVISAGCIIALFSSVLSGLFSARLQPFQFSVLRSSHLIFSPRGGQIKYNWTNVMIMPGIPGTARGRYSIFHFLCFQTSLCEIRKSHKNMCTIFMLMLSPPHRSHLLPFLRTQHLWVWQLFLYHPSYHGIERDLENLGNRVGVREYDTREFLARMTKSVFISSCLESTPMHSLASWNHLEHSETL